MTTNKLNSNLLSFISVAMYGTELEPENVLNIDYLDKDDIISIDHFWDFFDNSKYVDFIKENAQNFWDGSYEIEGINFTLKLGEIYSPKYYNFSNDEIDIEVSIDFDKLKEYVIENSEKFKDFIKERYSSRSGFIRYTASDFGEWLIKFENNREQEIAAAINFLIINSGTDLFDSLLINYIIDNNPPYIFDFLDENFDKEVDFADKALINFVQKNYMELDFDKVNISELKDDLMIDERFSDEWILSTLQSYIEAIENNTLKLKFS